MKNSHGNFSKSISLRTPIPGSLYDWESGRRFLCPHNLLGCKYHKWLLAWGQGRDEEEKQQSPFIHEWSVGITSPQPWGFSLLSNSNIGHLLGLMALQVHHVSYVSVLSLLNDIDRICVPGGNLCHDHPKLHSTPARLWMQKQLWCGLSVLTMTLWGRHPQMILSSTRLGIYQNLVSMLLLYERRIQKNYIDIYIIIYYIIIYYII